MPDRPIIFSGPMVRALLAGRKTQTRRIVKPRGKRRPSLLDNGWSDSYVLDPGNAEWLAQDLPAAVGDRLYVREAWCHTGDGVWSIDDARRALNGKPIYRATDEADAGTKWWPSIHMPREFSRLTLLVQGVKVERLQEISEADAIAESCEAKPFPGPWWQGYCDIGGELLHQQAIGETPPDWMIEPKRMKPTPWLDRSALDAFRMLWNALHTKPGERWDDNPFVVALTFSVVQGNIDRAPLPNKGPAA